MSTLRVFLIGRGLLLIILVFAILASTGYSLKTYANYTQEFDISAASHFFLNFTSNLSINDNMNHTFEGRGAGGTAVFNVEYISGNRSGFLIKLEIDNANDRVRAFQCNGDAPTGEICSGGCGGHDFSSYKNFTVLVKPASSEAEIFINYVSVGTTSLCSGIQQVDMINFTRSASLSKSQNNLVIGDNQGPTLVSSIPNRTIPEDTSTSFNISGNFSDPNNDTLTYSILSNVENVTVTINSTTGIVNLTPTLNFFGVRYVIFLVNDSDNVTLSNNVTLNVTPVNDIPLVSNVIMNNTDFLNRTNGSLVVGWAFTDIDGDVENGTEILWYINGTEKIEFRNLTLINSTNTTKNQNWTFGVRIFDGTNFSSFVNGTPLLIVNSAPTQSIPIITSNDEQNRKNGTLACGNQSTNDLDNDLVANFIRWHKNGELVTTAINLTALSAGNYSKSDNITCEINPNDGSADGNSLNSTNFTILNAAPILNNSIPNTAWNENTQTTLNLFNGFVDLDNDNLTYNFTPVSNIGISINNNTGIVALNPSSDFNGARTVTFFSFDGTNLTASNNVTLTVNDVPVPSPSGGPSGGSSGGGGGGGSAGGKYICELDWQCESWTECADGKQTRKCALVQVPAFLLDDKCPQFNVLEQSRSCESPLKESCSDGIQNQNEEGIDCGGVCEPCAVQETAQIVPEKEEAIFGPAVVAEPESNLNNLWLVLAVLLFAAAILMYAKVSHRRLFRKEQLSEKEMKKLNQMLSYDIFKKEK